ncbi:hypothetical protein L1887_62381 [Cichorium endivia]|nr:hypothetical protein L1887_62381 [Cichorium endivia]
MADRFAALAGYDAGLQLRLYTGAEPGSRNTRRFARTRDSGQHQPRPPPSKPLNSTFGKSKKPSAAAERARAHHFGPHGPWHRPIALARLRTTRPPARPTRRMRVSKSLPSTQAQAGAAKALRRVRIAEDDTFDELERQPSARPPAR